MHLVGLFHLYRISELIVLYVRNLFRQNVVSVVFRSINNTLPSDCQVMYRHTKNSVRISLRQICSVATY